MTEPIPVIPLSYAEPGPVRSPAWRGIVRVCHPLALFNCVIAWFVLFAKVESVVLSGPLLLVQAVLLLIGGLMNGDRRATAFGIGHAAVCLLFFLLVNLLNWSPEQAKWPFVVIGAAYTLGACTLAVATRPFRAPAEGSPAGHWAS